MDTKEHVVKKDCFIKDEGDFFTLGFVSEAAKEILRKETSKPSDWVGIYGDKILKMDFESVNNNKSKKLIIVWLISHNLSWEEF